MITELEISNFKSIKHLKEACTRINIFVGEPNAGKSNILEALGFLSYTQFHGNATLHQFIRYTRTTNLFHDDFIDEPFVIKLGPLSSRVQFENGTFSGKVFNGENWACDITGDYNNIGVLSVGPAFNQKPLVKFYRFGISDSYTRPESDFLLPPDGKNLVSLLLTNRDLRSTANDIFNKYGLKLVLKPHENKMEIMKQVEDVLISYPYMLVSDTLQRVIFHLSAILTNKDSVLVFEEPESHSFPYYTKHLAEIMALDQGNNQYFIATHNPYFLEPIVEKTPKEDLSVFVTSFSDYQTKVKPLSHDQIADLMRIDVFSNLEIYSKRS